MNQTNTKGVLIMVVLTFLRTDFKAHSTVFFKPESHLIRTFKIYTKQEKTEYASKNFTFLLI